MLAKHSPSGEPASKTVAVVVPLHLRNELTDEEQISFRHLEHFLGHYDKYIVVAKSLKVNYPGFGIKRFSDKFFGSLEAHRDLLLSPQFYEAFKEYKYIFMYHLDSLVFSDQLMKWCDEDLDYIGAPWLKCEDSPNIKEEKVGNGGFCLMKTESFLKVINSKRYFVEPHDYWKNFCDSHPTHIQLLNFHKKYLKRLKMFNGAKWFISRWKRNSDRFFAEHATRFYPQFKIASFETGLSFAFEVAPKLCFEMNKNTLPFGCHAWARYDKEFWEPYLLR